MLRAPASQDPARRGRSQAAPHLGASATYLAPVDPAFDDLERRVMAIERPKAQLLTLYLLYAGLTTVAAPIVFIPLYFRYHTLRFRFDREGIGVSYGILFRRETYLTYARIRTSTSRATS